MGALEEALIDSLIVGVMVEAELRAMLAVLATSEAIEQALYEKVSRIITDAGYTLGVDDGT